MGTARTCSKEGLWRTFVPNSSLFGPLCWSGHTRIQKEQEKDPHNREQGFPQS
eukprot:COSAG02_NODE_62338_length_266_cov_0.616766_1_plen_52_part_10